MSFNILLINKIKGFIVAESFSTNFSNFLTFCICVEAFQKWMKSRSYKIWNFIPFIFEFLQSVIFCNSMRMFREIAFEKNIIRNNKQFWKFYFIEIDIFEDKSNSFIKSKFFKFIKFMLKHYLKCPNSSINIQNF